MNEPLFYAYNIIKNVRKSFPNVNLFIKAVEDFFGTCREYEG